MAYTKLGFTVVPEGRYIPELATKLKAVPNMHSEIGDCLKKLGSQRRPLAGLSLPDLVRMSSSAIATDSPLQKALIIITTKALKNAGYIGDDIPRVDYVTNPVLNIEDAVGNILTKTLPWFTKEHMGGDKASLDVLSSHLPMLINELSYAETMRKEYYSRLRYKIGDIGYKVAHGLPITQQEKTFFITYASGVKGTPGHMLGMAGPDSTQPTAIAAKQNADPLVTEAFTLYSTLTETGPGARFYQLLSNMNMEQLVWYLGPYARALPLSIGYRASMGPFTEYRMTPVETIPWTPQDQMTGINEIFADLTVVARVVQQETGDSGAARAAAIAASPLKFNTTQWTLSAPAQICGYPNQECSKTFIDFPNVTLRLADEQDCSKFTWEYYSQWRKRILLSDTGAKGESLYVDLALSTEKAGEPQVDHLNVDAFSVADFTDNVLQRRLDITGDRIIEKIYHVRQGSTLDVAEVDMTDFYVRQGLEYFRPAFAEHVIPPRMWFFKEDQRAQAYISARLGLNNDQAFRNRLAITISHNFASFRRITGNDGKFDAVEVIKAILNIK